MSHRQILTSIVWIACLLSAGCVSTSPGDSAVGELIERQHQSVTVGQTVRFMLASNRTTGYEWTISLAASQGLEHISIKQTGYSETDSSQGEVGAPGRQWWLVQGDSPGRVQVHLVYRRPWEEDTPPARRALVTVDVSR